MYEYTPPNSPEITVHYEYQPPEHEGGHEVCPVDVLLADITVNGGKVSEDLLDILFDQWGDVWADEIIAKEAK